MIHFFVLRLKLTEALQVLKYTIIYVLVVALLASLIVLRELIRARLYDLLNDRCFSSCPLPRRHHIPLWCLFRYLIIVHASSSSLSTSRHTYRQRFRQSFTVHTSSIRVELWVRKEFCNLIDTFSIIFAYRDLIYIKYGTS